MISWIRKSMEDREEGFTLIELLVVVIIIGILAAVAIPVFLRQRERAWDSASESELRNAAVAMESFATDNNGAYTGATLADLDAEGFNLSPAFTASFAISRADANGYCMQAAHVSQPTVVFSLDSTVGAPTEAACTP